MAAGGVLTGDAAWAVIRETIATHNSIPAFTCSTPADLHLALESGQKIGRAICVRFDLDSARFIAGGALENDVGQASQLGVVVGAQLLKMLAPAYGVSVLLHTVAKKSTLPYLDGVLGVDRHTMEASGTTLFTSYGLDLASEPFEDIVSTCAAYLTKLTPLGLVLEARAPSAVEEPSLLARLYGPGHRIITRGSNFDVYGLSASERNIKVLVYSATSCDQRYLEEGNMAAGNRLKLSFTKDSLSLKTTALAAGHFGVCIFYHDEADAEVLTRLAQLGVRAIATRCPNVHMVDVPRARELGIAVCRVPSLGANAGAEHAVALMTSLNRHLPQAYAKSRTNNFHLNGQLGFDMNGKRVGIVGTGRRGRITAGILKRGFDCDVIAFDPKPDQAVEEMGVKYVELEEIWRTCDIISLHCHLSEDTKHLVDEATIEMMKPGVMIINTSRGALIDTAALLVGIKNKKIGSAGLDVYEFEKGYFFKNHSGQYLQDDMLSRLVRLPNVLVTSHQGWLTREAMAEMATTTVLNLVGIAQSGKPPPHGVEGLSTEVLPEMLEGLSDFVCHRGPMTHNCEVPFQRMLSGGYATGLASGNGGIKVAMFSSQPYDQEWFGKANLKIGDKLDFIHHACRLGEGTASLAAGAFAVCIFVNDDCSTPVVEALHALGIKMIALRCAGFNNVDLKRAQELGIAVARVPAYSPHAVAEHAVALMLTCQRHIPQSWHRARQGDFSLEGKMGTELRGKRVGVVGTGLIGSLAAKILKLGFECDVVAYDVRENPKVAAPPPEGLGIRYLPLDDVWSTCDLVTLHSPLFPSTHHMLNQDSIDKMKKGIIIVNTARGALIDSKALLNGLKRGIVGAAGLDVYEDESTSFFADLSNEVNEDDVMARLISFPNVIFTPHQAFFTNEAMAEISKTSVANIIGVFEEGEPPKQKGTLETRVLPR